MPGTNQKPCDCPNKCREKEILPLGMQKYPVMVGRHISGDLIIQAGGSFVRIPEPCVIDLPAAILVASQSEKGR